MARVRAAFEQFAADTAAAGVRQPTRLVLENLLAAETGLLRQIWAFGTGLVVGMAVVRRLGMTARLWAFAWV